MLLVKQGAFLLLIFSYDLFADMIKLFVVIYLTFVKNFGIIKEEKTDIIIKELLGVVF